MIYISVNQNKNDFSICLQVLNVTAGSRSTAGSADEDAGSELLKVHRLWVTVRVREWYWTVLRDFWTSPEVSGHFGTIRVVPTAELSWYQNILVPRVSFCNRAIFVQNLVDIRWMLTYIHAIVSGDIRSTQTHTLLGCWAFVWVSDYG